MPPKKASRGCKGYHSQRLDEITFEDKASSFFLALSHTGDAAQIQRGCVSIAIINGNWLIASNVVSISRGDIEIIQREVGYNFEYLVLPKIKYLHAEMAILEHLIQKGLSTDGVKLGVSKPCCFKCSTTLQEYDITHTHYHTKRVVNWAEPFLEPDEYKE